MAGTRILTRSWHGGEVSPEMLGRVDSVQFQSGAARIENWVVRPQGPVRVRPGFRYVAATKNNQRVRLIDFDAGNNERIMLEVGAGYVRFYNSDGTRVTVAGVADYQVSSSLVTMANGSTQVVWGAVHTFVDNQPVMFDDAGGTLPTNVAADTTYYVRSPIAGQFQISATPGGAAITFAYASAGTIVGRRRYYLGDLVRNVGVNYYCQLAEDSIAVFAAAPSWYALTTTTGTTSIYEIPNIYTLAHLRDLNYDQVNDVLTIAHVEQYPRELRRYGATNWQLVGIQIEPPLLAPTGFTGVAISQPRFEILIVTLAKPAEISFEGGSSTIHGLGPGDPVYVEGIAGTVATTILAPGFYKVQSSLGSPAWKLSLDRYDGTEVDTLTGGPFTYTSGTGRLQYWPRDVDSTTYYQITAVGVGGFETLPSAEAGVFNYIDAPGASNLLLWDPVAGALSYRIYRKESGVFGKIFTVDAATARKTKQLNSPTPYVFPFSAGKPFECNCTAHGFPEGMPFRFSLANGATLPGGAVPPLTTTDTYYVRNPRANSFAVTREPDSPGIDTALFIVGASGVVTITERWSVRDPNSEPELGETPPRRDAADLVTAGNFPGCVAHHEQRRFFAGSTLEENRFWASRSSTEGDYAYHLPSLATDRLEWAIAVRRRGAIRHMVPLGDLALLTASSEVRLAPTSDAVLAPDSISTLPQTHIGCSRVRPLLTAQTCTFVSDEKGDVWELGSSGGNMYRAGNLSLRAGHLFDGFAVLESAQSRAPYPVQWWLSSSGKILGMTYVPEEQVGAWHQHTTAGTFESIATLGHQAETHLWACVERVINGATVHWIERQADWAFDELEDWCGLDGSMTLVVGAPTTVITGLERFNGHEVQIVRDGIRHPARTVAAGQVTLNAPATSTVHVGLSYEARIHTLPVVLQTAAYAQGRRLNAVSADLRIDRSAGSLWAGPEGVPRRLTPNQSVPTLLSGVYDLMLPGQWNVGAPIELVLFDPFPVQLVAMTLRVELGDG